MWPLQHLWEPLLQMAPALPLEAPTNSKSLLEVEEIVQRKHEACLHRLIFMLSPEPRILLNSYSICLISWTNGLHDKRKEASIMVATHVQLWFLSKCCCCTYHDRKARNKKQSNWFHFLVVNQSWSLNRLVLCSHYGFIHLYIKSTLQQRHPLVSL